MKLNHTDTLKIMWGDEIKTARPANGWDGKKISYSYVGYDRRLPFEDSNAMMLTIQKIKEAEWYVED